MKRPVGTEIIAHWRESGEWWAGEQPQEFVQYRDAKGIRREKSRLLESLVVREAAKPYEEENHTEELSLRPRKIRNEKFAKAYGLINPDKPQLEDETPQVSIQNPQSTIRNPKSLDLRPSTFSPIHNPQSTIHNPYAPLHILSGYGFGRSVLFAEEIARLAANNGCPAAAIADPFSLVGAVEFAREAKKVGIKPLIGASFELECGGEIVLIAKDKRGYENLSQLISSCQLDEPRLYPLCTFARLEQFSVGLLSLTGGDVGPINRLLMARRFDEAKQLTKKLIDIFGSSNVFIEIERSYLPWQQTVNQRLLDLAESLDLTPFAGGIVTHASPKQFPAQDILVCSNTLCLVDEVIGRKPPRDPSQPQIQEPPARALNAERYLRSAEEMQKLYSDRPELLRNTLAIADRCDDDVLPSRTRLPQICDHPAEMLREVTLAGAKMRYKNIPPKLKKRIELELERVNKLNFADHFLTIWDACRWSTEQNILFSGRGSVVDCVIAYCLGLSRIDAFEHNLHFDRFLPADGSKRPDIDIDFEAKRRDDVRNYLTNKYGQGRVATVAAVGAFCTRGIVREVGKALGLPDETIGFLSKRIHGGVSPDQLENALQNRPELQQSDIPKERFQWVFRLAAMLADVPRNMRAHSSGVVISDRPLAETVPVQWSGAEGVQIIQWDKRSAKYYFDKFDILCLRGQDVLSGAQQRIRQQNLDFNVEQISLDDEDTYRTMRSGELIGIPQSASPAMRQAHIRMRTQNLHDASLVQAGIRPGVGGAVKINTLIARRRGLEQYEFEHPALEPILGITYGIVVFQEQIDQLLQTFCGYSSGEAEDIREKIHKRRREDYGLAIKDEVMARIQSRGFPPDVAEHVFELIRGFKGYGFAQGHALAFAEISLRSIYCQQNFPAEYFSSLLDAQPAGYYGPCTLVNEARTRGVAILPVDVNRSAEKFLVEDVQSEMDPKIVLPNAGIRIALTQIENLSTETRKHAAENGPYRSIFDFVQKTKPNRDELEQLILCGAFDTLHPNRRSLLWAIPQIMAFGAKTENALNLTIPEPKLPDHVDDFTYAEKAIRERNILGLDIHEHLMAFEREHVASKGGITSAEAKTLTPGRKAIVVGNPIRLRFPPTPSGKRVVFFDLEDETGLLNVTCFDAVYKRDGHAIVCSPYVTIIGVAQDRDGHTAFLAKRVFAYKPKLLESTKEPVPVGTADFLVS